MGRKASASNKTAVSEISTTSSLWVDVPQSSLDLKAIFPSYPSEDLIREIKDFCLDTGTPYLWRGHTHTKPPGDGKPPVYVGRIDISVEARKRKDFSPCPCCTPNHRKFGEGLIAWFEDEQVIRLIGRDCFATINQVGHDDAYRDLIQRENERRQLEYVLGIVDRLPHWISVAEELTEIAKAADTFFPIIENRIVKSQDVRNFWSEIRSGVLHVDEKVARNSVGRDGRDFEQDRDDKAQKEGDNFELVRVAILPLEGYAAMNPNRRELGPTLSSVVSALKVFQRTNREDVLTWSPNERQVIGRELKRCLDLISKARGDLGKQLPFLMQINVNRLNQWANDPRSPVYRHRFSIRRQEAKLIIGGRRGDYEFDIPVELRSVLLPTLDF